MYVYKTLYKTTQAVKTHPKPASMVTKQTGSEFFEQNRNVRLIQADFAARGLAFKVTSP